MKGKKENNLLLLILLIAVLILIGTFRQQYTGNLTIVGRQNYNQQVDNKFGGNSRSSIQTAATYACPGTYPLSNTQKKYVNTNLDCNAVDQGGTNINFVNKICNLAASNVGSAKCNSVSTKGLPCTTSVVGYTTYNINCNPAPKPGNKVGSQIYTEPGQTGNNQNWLIVSCTATGTIHCTEHLKKPKTKTKTSGPGDKTGPTTGGGGGGSDPICGNGKAETGETCGEPGLKCPPKTPGPQDKCVNCKCVPQTPPLNTNPCDSDPGPACQSTHKKCKTGLNPGYGGNDGICDQYCQCIPLV